MRLLPLLLIFFQVLQYMSTDVTVAQKKSLADFSQPWEDALCVKRGKKSKRRRCAIIFIDAIDQEAANKLQKREYKNHYVFSTYSFNYSNLYIAFPPQSHVQSKQPLFQLRKHIRMPNLNLFQMHLCPSLPHRPRR